MYSEPAGSVVLPIIYHPPSPLPSSKPPSHTTSTGMDHSASTGDLMLLHSSLALSAYHLQQLRTSWLRTSWLARWTMFTELIKVPILHHDLDQVALVRDEVVPNIRKTLQHTKNNEIKHPLSPNISFPGLVARVFTSQTRFTCKGNGICFYGTTVTVRCTWTLIKKV